MLAVLLLGFAGFVLAMLPRALLRRYCATFATRHDLGVRIGLVVLLSATLALILATLVEPGNDGLELLNAAVVAGLAVAGFADLRSVSRR